MRKFLWIMSMFLFVACGPSQQSTVDAVQTPVPTPIIETFKVKFDGSLIIDANLNGFAETGEGVAGEEIQIFVQGLTGVETIVVTGVDGMFESDTFDVSQVKDEGLLFALAIPRFESCEPDIQVTISEANGVETYHIEILLDDLCPFEDDLEEENLEENIS